MGKMAGKGESLYNIKQEGKFGWLWTDHLNCSPGGAFVKHNCMNLTKLRNIDHTETFFVIILDQILCKKFYFSSVDYFVQQSKTVCVVLVGLTRNGIKSVYKLFLIWRCLKYFISRALVTILAGTAESFRHF